MKVIDVLNKISNGEHDFKFKYCDLEYFWDFSSKAFIDTENKMTFGERWEIDNILNDEVEVIEEEPRDIKVCGSLFTRSEYNRLAGIKEDKTIQTIHDFQIGCGAVTKDRIEPYIKTLFHQQAILYLKINEIIDKINKGE